jgi:hypothetical protein
MKRESASNNRFVVIIGLIITMNWYGYATAYVLQGPHILELMVENIGKANRLVIEQKLILHENPQGHAPIEFKETVRYLFPETYRSDILSETTQRIHVLAKGTAFTAVDGKYSMEAESGFDRYKDLILYHSRKRLERRLASTGVDVSVSSFGKFQDNIAFVLGAEYPDNARSQLWIEKDSFLPIRWLLKTGSTQDSLEFRYQRWQKIDGIQYPMHIECYLDGKLVREMRVDAYTVDPVFSKDLFDIQLLQSLYLKQTSAEDVSDERNEVQKTIEEFKMLYESDQ